MTFMDQTIDDMPHGKARTTPRTPAQKAAELLGRRGGQSRSPKKVAASRINAAKALEARKALEAKLQ